jgi:hypothetical protein
MIEAAAVVGALGALAAILPRSRFWLVGGLAALAGAEVALGEELAPGGLLSKLGSPEGAAALAAGLALVAGGAALLVRYPAILPPLVVAAAPLRLPLEFGADKTLYVGLGEPGSLGRLLPLYAVIAAGGAALAWRALRGEEPRPLPRPLALPAALLLALLLLSLLWAYDLPAALDRAVFFIVPFAVLLAVVARSPFRPWLPRALAYVAVALGCVFAAVGLGEAWARELIFYDPKIAVANTYSSYFRVTSLFSDASIYGRHLVAAIVVVVVALWLGRVHFILGAALVAFLWAGLFFSYSQSSMLALGAAVIVVSYLVADRRGRRLVAASAAALVIVGTVAFFTLLREESAARITSNRSTLVTDTLTVFANHPAVGVGVASQPAASRDEADAARRARRATSHTAPLTVAAELGVVGLALYLAFLVGTVRLLAAVRRRDEALGLALAGVVVVFFVHSLFYGVFFDDPLLWAALGIAAAAGVVQKRPVTKTAPLRREPKSAPAPAH